MDGDRLRRSGPDRVLAGVCGGLGEALGIDPVLLRLGFAVAVPLGGIGLAAYVVAAVLMPGPPPGAPVRPLRERRQQVAGLAALLAAALLALSAGELLLPLGVLAPSALLLVGLGLAWRQAATARRARARAGRGRWCSTGCAP